MNVFQCRNCNYRCSWQEPREDDFYPVEPNEVFFSRRFFEEDDQKEFIPESGYLWTCPQCGAKGLVRGSGELPELSGHEEKRNETIVEFEVQKRSIGFLSCLFTRIGYLYPSSGKTENKP